ncbi:MBG domain-containing protein [Shinella sp.]|uniref:MBG domain-containing protein n=1 Tax=Shinella sp. TaxID=1870904 RepID=UPI00301DDA71
MIALLTSTAMVSVNLPGAPAHADDLPTGGSVAAGSATIGASGGNGLVINQTSANAVINWQSYNIGAGNTVTYVQPDTNAAILNRVTGSATTTIAGQLSANGQVYIVNPNGIAITSTGTINTGAFVASTLGISDDDFMAGKRTFTGNGASNAVTNAGQITINRGGYMALIGGSLENSGAITVPMGKAALGSGEQATLDLAGDGFLQVAIPTGADGKNALVSNSGHISASGGTVQLTAAAAKDMARQAVNMSGAIEAKGVSGKSGDILLFGSEGEVAVSGTIDVGNAHDNGGRVKVTGRSIKLDNAKIDASGQTGGGTVRIGGGRQGSGTLQHADMLSADAHTVINADAISTGKGGDVVLWSDYQTGFAGTIFARGGSISGNGGEVEVSGKAWLAYTGLTDLSASNGAFGNLLLDPYNVIISTGADTGGFTASGNDSVINVTALINALASANVTVTTGTEGSQAGEIRIIAPITWSAPTTLTLDAATNISVNAAVTANAGGLRLIAGSLAWGIADVSIGGIFELASGQWTQNAATLPSFYARDFRIAAGAVFRRVAGGSGTADAAYRITDIYGLQGLSSSFVQQSMEWRLAQDIDASITATWNGGAGFKPVTLQADGVFDGAGHTITALTINRPSEHHVGLFDFNEGKIRNIGLRGGSVSGATYAGGLVSDNLGEISNSYAAVDVSGMGMMVGGLVATNDGTIISSYANGSVTGSQYYVGGLVGYHAGTISNSYATGNVTSSGYYTGGLVGHIAFGQVNGSHATGNVSGGDLYVGGIAGSNDGSVIYAYATGNVSGDGYVGGLVGTNFGRMESVYATGRVLGPVGYAGGIAGYNQTANGIENAYFDTETTGQSNAIGDGVRTTVGIVAGLTTAQARDAASYTGFDFTNAWYQNGDMRPIQRSQAASAVDGVIAVSNLNQLALMATNLSASYRLSGDIDASATAGTNASGIWGAGGWKPVGEGALSSIFSGTFDGAGHTITGLTINRPDEDYVGLFGRLRNDAAISNIGLVGGRVVGRNYTGGLVGYIGGLNGYGSISNVHAAIDVSGAYSTGGLIGSSGLLLIINARSSGNVTGTGNAVGGLAGFNLGEISNSYATGNVTSRGNNVGGLVGHNVGGIERAYATGNVSGNQYVGGLAGVNEVWIHDTYAAGSVTGALNVGSLVGWNMFADRVGASYFDAQATGQSQGVGDGFADGITALTSAQMADPFTFIDGGWDFASTWAKPKTGGAPVLRSLTNDAFYDYYVRFSGNTDRVYGDALGVPAVSLHGPGAGNVGVNWGSALTAGNGTPDAGAYAYSDAGVLAFSYGAGSAADYYLDYGTGHLIIARRAITVAADAQTKTYGDANPTLTYTVSGLVSGDALSGALTTSAGRYSDVGSYAIDQGTLANGNYAITYTGADLTIGQRAITVTADAQSKTYGDTNPTLVYTATGLVNGDALSGALTTSAGRYSDVGIYSIDQGTLANGNYAITYTGAELNIGQRAITVAANAQTKTYGDANPALTYTATGLVNGDTLSGSLSTAADARSDIGDYAIGQGTLDNGNYAITYTGADLTIGQRSITVAANARTKTYGDANPTLTYTATGLVNGDTLSGTLATLAGRYSDVGSYAIDQGTLANGNYAITYTGAGLTIGIRTLTVGADARTKTYGDANPALTYTVAGLVNGDTLSGALNTSAGQYSNVGSYDITVGSLAASSNYAISYTGADLTIGQRSITVDADAQSKTYGDVNPALTYSVSGLLNGDTLSGALATAAGQYSNVGNYAIDLGTLAASSNYAINYTDANLTIGQRSITVAANAQTKTYGDANPALTYTAIGLVNGDTLSGSLATTADVRSDIGTYAIGPGTLANANYALTYTAADLTITPRAIIVAANDLKRYYGTENPALTWTAGGMGLVNGDTLSGSLATTATRTSALGQYAITQGTLMASTNYALTFDGGNLTVEALPAMPAGTSASIPSGHAFDTRRFGARPPASDEGAWSADGSTVLIGDPRFDGAVVCLDDGACVTMPTPKQQ